MLIICLWKYVIEEIDWMYKLNIIELLWNLIIGIFLTIPVLWLDIVLAPIELITLIVYKILKKKKEKIDAITNSKKRNKNIGRK